MNERLAFAAVGTPVGRVVVAVTTVGLAAVAFDDTQAERARMADAIGLPAVEDAAVTAEALDQIGGYFSGELKEFRLPIDWRLTSRLQRRVLETLFETVGHGEVVTYGRLGERSGTGVPARAIGQVMGSNPIPLVVPCHRVVAGTGLGGFSGGSGIEVKRWLLTFEGALPPTLDWDPLGPV